MVYRVDSALAISTPPPVGTPGEEAYPTAGSPPSVPATPIDPYTTYMLIEEIRNVVIDAGIAPVKGNVAQLLAALNAKRPTFSQICIAYPFQSSVSGSGTTATVSFTPARSGVIMLVANGDSLAGNLNLFTLTGSGYSSLGGGPNYSPTGPAVMNYLLSVSAGVPVTLNVNIGSSSSSTVSAFGSALYFPNS